MTLTVAGSHPKLRPVIEPEPTPEQTLRLTRAEIETVQRRKLSAMLAALWEGNRFYRRKLEGSGLTPDDLADPRRLRRCPTTTKEELSLDQEAFPPYGSNLTYPLERYVRLHQTSGTRGRPLRWLDTPESWAWFMRCWEVIYQAAGVRPGDRFFFPFSFGPFIGFWAAFEAAARQGRLALPGGGMNTAARLAFMLDHRATVIACTPTYALHMAEVAEREGIDLPASPVRMLIVAGEPGGNIPETKALIERRWGARCIDHAGMTEIGSLAFESEADPGRLKLIETECIAEVLDPTSGEPVGPGGRGELVLTNLGRWGSPLLRYRTGDLVQIDPAPAADGSSLLSLRGGILGRLDDMVIIRGNNVYPSALESVLRRLPGLAEWRAEVVPLQGLLQLRLTVESSAPLGSNGEPLAGQVARAVKDAFSFVPEVAVVAPDSLPRSELKASRFTIYSSPMRSA